MELSRDTYNANKEAFSTNLREDGLQQKIIIWPPKKGMNYSVKNTLDDWESFYNNSTPIPLKEKQYDEIFKCLKYNISPSDKDSTCYLILHKKGDVTVGIVKVVVYEELRGIISLVILNPKIAIETGEALPAIEKNLILSAIQNIFDDERYNTIPCIRFIPILDETKDFIKTLRFEDIKLNEAEDVKQSE